MDVGLIRLVAGVAAGAVGFSPHAATSIIAAVSVTGRFMGGGVKSESTATDGACPESVLSIGKPTSFATLAFPGHARVKFP
jgi:hypothetical protein